MSVQSISITFLATHEIAARFTDTVESPGLRDLPENIDRDFFLYVSSRNNATEHDLRVLVEAFQCGGLSYLRQWDEIVNRPPWIVALHGTRLTDAIAGIHHLVSALREEPARCALLIPFGPSESDVVEALQMPAPASFAGGT